VTDGAAAAVQLADLDELLFRQVHPSWVRDAEPTSQAFKPTPKDTGRLSVARASMTTAEAAFQLHTRSRGFGSEGTWAVTLEEVRRAPISLPAFHDPLTEPVADPAHAYIDFTGRSRKEIETKAKLLLAAARARGRLHPAETS